MKKVFNNTYLKLFVIMTISLFIEEIIFRIISDSYVFSFGTLRIFIEVVIISGLLSFMINLCKHSIAKKILLGIVIFAGAFYTCFQLGFNSFIGVFASLNASSQLDEVKDYVKDFFASFRPEYFLTLIPFVLYIIGAIVFRKDKLNRTKVWKTAIYTFIIEAIAIGLYVASIFAPGLQNELQLVSNKDLFMTASNPSITVDQYGTFGFLFIDLRAYLFPVEIENNNVQEIVERPVEDINENSRIIDDNAWLSVIGNEENQSYKEIDTYLINQKITDKNEMTGIFKDKNVIFILGESVNDIIYEYPQYYPNFAKMVEHSYFYENNYSPRNSCATLNNEFSGMTSLYSIVNTCTASTYKNNTYPQSIFGLYNKAGYVTFSAHDYTEAYYPRPTLHKNLGSGEYYNVQKLGIKYSNEYKNWADDDEFFASVLKIIDKKRTTEDTKFMAWLTTVSSHQPYSQDSIQGNAFYSMTDKTGFPSDVRRFMSKLKIVDNALGTLMDGLEKRGILDDTVIVFYGDHYPYGINKDYLNKVLSYDTKKDMNSEQVPFLIYNPSIEGVKKQEYTTYVNILPTLANMFDLDYDPRYYVGEDLFSDDYQSIVVFADGSWKNEIAYYNASKNQIKYYTDKTYTPEEIKNINNKVNAKINYSNKIVKNNYFEDLNNKLTTKQKEIDALKQVMCLNDYIDEYKNTEQEIQVEE